MSEKGRCGLCGQQDTDLVSNWYGSKISLCASCRRVVVARHDRQYPDLYTQGRFYAHVGRSVPQEDRSNFPWPYARHEARPAPDAFDYYRSVRAYIEREALGGPQARQAYTEASMASPKPLKPVQRVSEASTPKPVLVPPPAPMMSAKRRKKLEEAGMRQATLFGEFPPN